MSEENTNSVPEAAAPQEAAPEPAAVSKDETKSVEVPAKFKKIVDEIESMSVADLNALVKVFEEKFGVSATAVAVAPAGGAGADAGGGKSTFTVKLTDGGAQKIAVIKVVKEALALGLKEAKDLVDGTPSVLKENMKKEEAEELKKKIEAAGGKVELA
jgi:large subunit ribosomal protein L7/L12